MQLKTSDNGRGAAGSERAAAQIFDNMGLKDIFGRKRNLSAVEKEVENPQTMIPKEAPKAIKAGEKNLITAKTFSNAPCSFSRISWPEPNWLQKPAN